MSYASNLRPNSQNQGNIRAQSRQALSKAANRGNGIPELLRQAQQQGNGDKINRILQSTGVNPTDLNQVLGSNDTQNSALQNIIQQAGDNALPQGALLVLNRESLVLVQAQEGTLLAASDQAFLLGGGNNFDEGILAANDEGFLYVQDNQSSNVDVYQYGGDNQGQYNDGTWGDEEYIPNAQSQYRPSRTGRAARGYNWGAADDVRSARYARSDRNVANRSW